MHAHLIRAIEEYPGPTDEDRKFLANLKLVPLVGPTAAGRNTLIAELTKTGHYHYIRSDTTRDPQIRNGMIEVDGEIYNFITESTALDKLLTRKYIEAVYVHDSYMNAIDTHELKLANDSSRTAIKDVEIHGEAKIKAMKSDARVFFVLPPNFDEWMRRLHARGELPAEEVERRLHSAKQELEDMIKNPVYECIINDDLLATANRLHAMIMDDHKHQEWHEEGIQVAKELLEKLLH